MSNRTLNRSTHLQGVAVFAFVLLALLGTVRLLAMLPDSASRNDFAHYYISSQALLAGENPYSVPLASRYAELGFEYDERIPFATNPPALLWLFAPLATLSPARACVAWHAIQLAALALTIGLTCWLLREKLSSLAIALIVAAVLLCNPLYWHVYHSQVQLLLGALLLGAFAMRQKGHSTTACLFVLAAGLVKLFPLALLPWFAWERQQTLRSNAARMGIVVGVALLAVVFTDPQLWWGFADQGLAIVSSNAVNRTFNFGLPSLLGNLTFAWYDFSPSNLAIFWSRHVGLALGLTIIAVGYISVIWGRAEPSKQFSLLMLVMLAGSPTMWGHYLVLLIYPATVVALSLNRSRPIQRAIAVASLMVILMAGTGTPAWLGDFPLINVLAHYLPLAGILALAFILARDLLRVKSTAVRAIVDTPTVQKRGLSIQEI